MRSNVKGPKIRDRGSKWKQRHENILLKGPASFLIIRHCTASWKSPHNDPTLSSECVIPQPQFHRTETVVSATLRLAELNHYRCQMVSEHSQEDQSSATQVHNPPTSREESIRLETAGNKLTNFRQSSFDGLNHL